MTTRREAGRKGGLRSAKKRAAAEGDEESHPARVRHIVPYRPTATGTIMDFESTRMFELFRAAYPCVVRDCCRKIWQELQVDEPMLQDILAGLAMWQATHQWQTAEGRYIPDASRFLRERHWDKQPTSLQRYGRTAQEARGSHRRAAATWEDDPYQAENEAALDALSYGYSLSQSSETEVKR